MNRNTPQTRIDAARLTGWICLLAVCLRVLLPMAMHSTAVADIPSLIVLTADADDDDDGCALEDHDHNAGHDDDHDAVHGHGGCLACQAMHFMAGGCAASALAMPVGMPAAMVSRALPPAVDSAAFAVPRFFQARAPPAFSI